MRPAMGWYIRAMEFWFLFLALAAGAYGFAGWCHLRHLRERQSLRGESAALREELLAALKATKEAWTNALSVNCVQTTQLRKDLGELQAAMARTKMEIASRREPKKEAADAPLGPDDFPEWPKEFKEQIDWERFTG